MSTQVTPIASYRSPTSTLDHRGWNLPLCFQEVFTAIVRLRYNRQAVTNADSFRMQMKQALKKAEEDSRARGYAAEDVTQVIFAVVAFLDESILSCRNPVFADWPRLPLQTELFGQQNAGEIVFQQIQRFLTRNDTHELADVLEDYYLCLALGFKGRYAASGVGNVQSLMATIRQKIGRVRGASSALSPRGALPSDAMRIVRVDSLVRRLGILAVLAILVTVLGFALFKALLISGV